jgi:glycosyltransferase involved in cell wall biosynthesis
MKLDLVSVILPNYNSGESLKFSVDSVLAQTYEKLELIIVDDGSIDEFKSIVQGFELLDPRVKIIYLAKNCGRSYARNVAIKHSIGRYLSFIDAGDIWSIKKLEKQIELLGKSNAIGICSSYSLFYDYSNIYNSTKVISTKLDKVYSKDLKFVNPIPMSTSIVDAHKIGRCIFENGYKEDYKFWICVLSGNGYFLTMKENLVYYHSPTGSRLLLKKIFNAKEQYKIYRLNFKFGVIKSIYFFIVYALLSIKKYV